MCAICVDPSPAPFPGRRHPPVLGERLPVPWPMARTVRHVNLDYAATAPCLAVGRGPRWPNCFRGTRASTVAPAPPSQRAPTRVRAGPRDQSREFIGCPRRRPRRLHPQHHRCAEPAGPSAPGRHHRRRLRAGEHHANLLPWRRHGSSGCPRRVAADARRRCRPSRAAAWPTSPAGPRSCSPSPAASNVTGEMCRSPPGRDRPPARRPHRRRRRPTGAAPAGRPRRLGRRLCRPVRPQALRPVRRRRPGRPGRLARRRPAVPAPAAVRPRASATPPRRALADRTGPARGRYAEPARRGRAGRRLRRAGPRRPRCAGDGRERTAGSAARRP